MERIQKEKEEKKNEEMKKKLMAKTIKEDFFTVMGLLQKKLQTRTI